MYFIYDKQCDLEKEWTSTLFNQTCSSQTLLPYLMDMNGRAAHLLHADVRSVWFE